MDPAPPRRSRVHAAVDAVHDALELLTTADLDVLAIEDLRLLTGRLLQVGHRVDAATLRLVHSLDRRGVAVERGWTSTAAWLRAAHRLHPATATRLVRTAKALHDDPAGPLVAASRRRGDPAPAGAAGRLRRRPGLRRARRGDHHRGHRPARLSGSGRANGRRDRTGAGCRRPRPEDPRAHRHPPAAHPGRHRRRRPGRQGEPPGRHPRAADPAAERRLLEGPRRARPRAHRGPLLPTQPAGRTRSPPPTATATCGPRPNATPTPWPSCCAATPAPSCPPPATARRPPSPSR